MNKTASWVTAFFAIAGINNVGQIDVAKHHNLINSAATEGHSKALVMLGGLIRDARRHKGELCVYEFKHIEGDPGCICAMCAGEAKDILAKMYAYYGVQFDLDEEKGEIKIFATA